MNNLTVSGAKALARNLMARMQAVGVPMTLAQALEGVAATNNHSDWNRFREHLKHASPGEASLPFERTSSALLIATKAGHDAELVLAHEVQYQMREAGKFPVVVELTGTKGEDPLGRSVLIGEVNLTLAFYNEVDQSIHFADEPRHTNCKGTVISLMAGSANHARMLRRDEIEGAWKALIPVLASIFTPEQLTQGGMLAIRGYESVDRDDGTDYDVAFPFLLDRERFSSKDLVVVTETDRSRESLYRSPLAWRMIVMAGDESRLFYRCPFSRVCIHPYHQPAQAYYSRIFSDPNRRIEDAALLMSHRTDSAWASPLPIQNEYSESAQDFLRDWYTKKKGVAYRLRSEQAHLFQL